MQDIMKQNEVLVIGAAISDLQLQPTPADVMDRGLTFLEEFALSIGGDAINEAAIITNLGHQVTLLSMVGKDAPGEFVLDYCRTHGIDSSAFTIRDNINTTINVGLISDAGVRSCITARNSTLWQLALEDLKLEYFDYGYKLLSFASIFTHDKIDCQLSSLFKKAKERGMIICADMQGGIDNKENYEEAIRAMAYVDYIFPNYGEACWMTGKTDPDEIADVFLSWGVKHVIVKTGAKGCLIKSNTERHELPAYTKVKCVDETGAGDNFAAGFISAILEGKSFRECAQFATAVASIAVEHVGASTGVKTRAQVDARLKEYLEFIGE